MDQIELLDHLTACKEIRLGSYTNATYKLFTNHIFNICINQPTLKTKLNCPNHILLGHSLHSKQPLSMAVGKGGVTFSKLNYNIGGQAEVRTSCVTGFLYDSILRLFYFNPRCLVDVTPWTRRPIEDERRLFKFFSFISWVQQPFNGWGNFPWIQLKWLNPLVKVFKNMLIVSWYMCVLICYIKALTTC